MPDDPITKDAEDFATGLLIGMGFKDRASFAESKRRRKDRNPNLAINTIKGELSTLDELAILAKMQQVSSPGPPPLGAGPLGGGPPPLGGIGGGSGLGGPPGLGGGGIPPPPPAPDPAILAQLLQAQGGGGI